MQGKIYLDVRKGQQLKSGAYPLRVELTGNGIQKRYGLKMSFHKEEWNFDKQEPKKDKTKLLLVRKKKSLLDSLLLKSLDDGSITFDYIKKALNGKLETLNNIATSQKKSTVDFFDFGYELANEKRQIISSKGVKKEGNAKVYDNALNQFIKFMPKIDIAKLDYVTLVKFKNEQLQVSKGDYRNNRTS